MNGNGAGARPRRRVRRTAAMAPLSRAYVKMSISSEELVALLSHWMNAIHGDRLGTETGSLSASPTDRREHALVMFARRVFSLKCTRTPCDGVSVDAAVVRDDARLPHLLQALRLGLRKQVIDVVRERAAGRPLQREL